MAAARSTSDILTLVIAGYAAIVSTALSAVAIYRDRYRLKIHVEWITHPVAGISVKCVNTGRRPVGVERIMFGSSRAWPPFWRLWPAQARPGNLGWLGEEYPEPPSPSTDLPCHLEIAREVVQHYLLDARIVEECDGILVFDSFGRTHRYRFRSPDRVGLSHAIAAPLEKYVLDADELHALAQHYREGEDQDPALTHMFSGLEGKARRLGIRFQVAIDETPGRPAGAMMARPIVNEEMVTDDDFTLDGPTFRIQRPPPPILPTVILLALMTAMLVLILSTSNPDGAPLIKLALLLAATLVSAILLGLLAGWLLVRGRAARRARTLARRAHPPA